MARSTAFDRVAINGQVREVTWQPVERPMARRIMIVNLHLKRGVCGASGFVGE